MSTPRRITRPLLDVLAYFVVLGDEAHGWAIMQATRRTGPTVYRVLERLEDDGWVTARWAEEPHPRRRLYRLTDEGLRRARLTLIGRDRTAPPAHG